MSRLLRWGAFFYSIHKVVGRPGHFFRSPVKNAVFHELALYGVQNSGFSSVQWWEAEGQ